ncbi:hypothetical protein [Neobacillus ginsengisoli]|uniref:Uncharacterized protein n=1 Tax=Neobacillus ginsengisoli TaxID=904295 RepID=A0ABT9XPL0_9BACI|nr:hypothetical protein [Neobacillus ginsengisoli]MDQ0196934.1 hypothetical protein [Neobacillus ginsengisoli]
MQISISHEMFANENQAMVLSTLAEKFESLENCPFIGTDFQGTVLAVVNIVPLMIMGGLLLKDRQKLNVSH